MSQHLIDDGRRASAAPSMGHGSTNMRAIEGEGGRDAPGVDASSELNGKDPTIAALDALSRALEEMDKDRALLQSRLDALRRQRAEGTPWREILSREDPPGSMQVVSRMLACLAKASGTLRKELVDTLRREGVSIPAIARLFGVTHQRVSNLLRRPAGE